jgi:hypothetical protein
VQLVIQELLELQETAVLVVQVLRLILMLLVDLLVMLAELVELVITAPPVDQVTLEDQVMLVVHHSQFPLYLD